MRLYKVSFTLTDSYRPKAECWLNLSLVVNAENQFSALQVAWDKLSPLNLPEPESFNAERVAKGDC
jgi:hypothetical protein